MTACTLSKYVRSSLKLNCNKTGFILFASKLHRKKNETLTSSYVKALASARNLGIILNSTLKMKKQVNYIFKSCYCQIGNIEVLRKYIKEETCNVRPSSFFSPVDSALLFDVSLSNRLPTVLAELCYRLVTSVL